ncbi:MAG: nitroreductase family protein [Burkholderiaceae bacterium]
MTRADADAGALRRVLADRFGEAVPVPEGTAGLPELLRMAGAASHRAWSPEPVGADLVRLLAACALAAPSKSFLQQAVIIDVRDPAQRRSVQALVPGMPWMADAAALLVFCANGRRFKRLFERRGQPFTNDHLDGFFNPTVDAAMVMMNFIQAAGAAGLACCPISMLRNEPEALTAILELPERVVPVAGLCIGYPAQARPINPRLSLRATLHEDRYGKVDDDALTDEFDTRYVAARAAALPADAPAPRRWSDERAYQYAQSHRPGWGAYVRSRKFRTD